MRRISIVFLAALALAAGAAHTSLAAGVKPLHGTQPIILGEVTDITSHLVSVRAVDGEIVPLEFDSRTVMRDGLTAGTPVKVEFKLLDNGIHLAQRVTPLEKGSLDWDTYAAAIGADGTYDDNDVRPAVAEDRTTASSTYENASTEGHDGDHDANVLSDSDHHEGDTNAAQNGDKNDGADQTSSVNSEQVTTTSDNNDNNNSNNNERLPDTASAMPTVLFVGLLLLAGAVSLWWNRRNVA